MSYVTLNGAFQNLSGTTGNLVFAETPDGVIVRQRVTPDNPRTPAQVAARARFTEARAAYNALSDAEADAWAEYAASLTKFNPRRGRLVHLRPNMLFTGLACKFLQVSPGGTIPVSPPAAPFPGDALALTVAPDAGRLVFTASAPNATGVTTELLIQRLSSPRRTPRPDAYRTARFCAYVPGALSADVEVTPGRCACAYRFVKVATGQHTDLFPLGSYTVA